MEEDGGAPVWEEWRVEQLHAARPACGIIALSTDADGQDGFWRDLGDVATSGDFVCLFFSRNRFAAASIVSHMHAACPGVAWAACSTAGEITPDGLTEGHLVALVFAATRFRVATTRIADIASAGFERIVATVSEAKRGFLAASPDLSAGRFALCLIDGLSFAEETATAALHWGLDDIPLLGGSAGDNMEFSETNLILDGDLAANSAILMLFETRVPFHIFKTDNFVPTADKLVVTRSDPERRIVHEFNAAPAAAEYARIIGMEPGSLSPLSFASHPLVVRVGGEYYCRSVQKMNPDGSLTFFCAIDDGIVLTVAEPTGMARTTRAAFDAVNAHLGGIDLVIGFDCVLRQIDARNRQVTAAISEIYRSNRVVGFNTYGEQYISMHLNQTFTGIAFGADPSEQP